MQNANMISKQQGVSETQYKGTPFFLSLFDENTYHDKTIIPISTQTNS